MTISSNPAQTQARKEKLEVMYAEFYNGKLGQCRFYEDCACGLVNENPNGYRFSYAALVGSHYDLSLTANNKNIRILFVGKEGRSGNSKLDTPVRLSDFSLEKKVNLHYRETYKMLCEMLGYNWKNGKCKDKFKFLNKPDANLACYALTNLYRCAFKKNDDDVRNIPNSDAQKERCLSILREEIRILEPTVIVLQKGDLHAEMIAGDAEPVDSAIGLFYSKKSDAHILETIHPSNYGKWYRTYKPRFTKAVNYLKAKGKLPAPDCDTTDALNEIVG